MEDIDNILDWQPPAKYKNDFKSQYLGNDHEGRPIIVISVGFWDVKKVANSGDKHKFLRYMSYLMAKVAGRMEESSRILNREVTQMILIADFENLSMMQFTSVGSNSN